MVKATADNIKSIGYAAKVKLRPAYGSGAKYFMTYLHGDGCMLADCKRDLKNDMGYIYSIHDIAAFEAAN